MQRGTGRLPAEISARRLMFSMSQRPMTAIGLWKREQHHTDSFGRATKPRNADTHRMREIKIREISAAA